MLITTEVEMKWHLQNKQWYQDKGYIFTNYADVFMVSPKDLKNGSHARVKYKCDICKNIVATEYRCYVKRPDSLCVSCATRTKSANKQKLPFEKVVSLFNTRGYQLISTNEDFINTKSRLRYLCTKHGEQKISYHSLQSGSGCSKCGDESGTSKSLVPFKVVLSAFIAKNYILISKKEDYKNSGSRLRFICNKHGEQKISYGSLRNGCGCSECGYESAVDKISGENHYLFGKPSECSPTWKGGLTDLNNHLRKHIELWTQCVLRVANYTCEITGIKSSGSLNVHHMYPFAKIRDLTLKQLNLPIYRTIGEYGDNLEILTSKFMENNNALANPIVMTQKLHSEFHSFCGGYHKETSIEQLEEFKRIFLSRPQKEAL